MAQTNTPTLAGRKMSDSLRERLKRSSRYYSPQVPKRQCAVTDQVPCDIEQDKDTSALDQLAVLEDNSHTDCEKVKDESSQDFEYSDEESDTEETNLPPIPNIRMQLEEASPEKCTQTIAKRTVPKDELITPKFQRTKRKALIVDSTHDTHDTNTEVCAASKDVKYVIEDAKLKEKSQVPSFKRTQGRRLKKSEKETTRTSTNPIVESDQLERNMTSESNQREATSTGQFEEEKTDIISREEMDAMSEKELNILKNRVHQQLERKKETLRKLKMVKMYRSKNNLQELARLISKWKTVSHEALEELLGILQTSEHQHIGSVYQLAKYFQLDVELLGIRPDEDSQDQ